MPDYPAIAAEVMARMTEIDARLQATPVADESDEDSLRILALNDVLEKAFPNSDGLEVAGYLLTALNRLDHAATTPPTSRLQAVEKLLRMHFDL